MIVSNLRHVSIIHYLVLLGLYRIDFTMATLFFIS